MKHFKHFNKSLEAQNPPPSGATIFNKIDGLLRVIKLKKAEIKYLTSRA